MAVKKHELVHDNCNQLDLAALAQYIQLMTTQSNFLPPPNELIKSGQDIVKCLARTPGNAQQLWHLLTSVDEFLIQLLRSVSSGVREEIVTAVLDKFYSLISDPQSDACPATSVVLSVVDINDGDAMLSAARWMVQKGDNGPAGAGLRASLSCFYRWICGWHGTPSLGQWVGAYIKALEENNRHDILIEVSVDNLARLFVAMEDPEILRSSVIHVIFHVLASLRESTEAFDKISPHVGHVLMTLAADSNLWTRQHLQNAVDILTASLENLIDSVKGEALDALKEKHADMISCLERHMAGRGCRYLQFPAWRMRNTFPSTVNAHASMRKVGLLNLGNTCYMNSILQALLFTRQFSTHVMLKMNSVPYWSKMGMLFAKMMHSISTKLDPGEFFVIVRPPHFTRNQQHDSSEFLGYLFELLQRHEHSSELNFHYTRAGARSTAARRPIAQPPAAQGTVPSSSTDTELPDQASNRRSMSPRPGSSDADPSSSNKPPKKRARLSESPVPHRESYIDDLFGGVLLTRVECSDCHTSSLSRDVFRDLQLAFPDRPEEFQHTVQNLLDFYCSKEQLTGDNQYHCRDCGGLRDAERSVLIETTPKYLILVLKTFKFESKLRVQTKLLHTIHHNLNVTLPTVRSQTEHSTYTLYATVIHSGTTLDSGHYYTLAKDKDQWYSYNDDIVSITDETQINRLHQSSTPYILFYRRTDVEEGTALSMDELPPTLQECVLSYNKEYVDMVRNKRLTCP